ncbi:MAG: hypothetical protein ACYDHM_09110 [Acidiferrobacterales bacterium]
MGEPTIAKRLQRRFILMTSDADIEALLRAAVPDGWEMVATPSLEEIGDWADILLYRFILMDLDATQGFDPVEVVHDLRTQHMLQTAVFCFGGDPALRDAMRLNRADRFFEREEIAGRLGSFLQQYGW